jgi:hypothetical protein
MNKDPTKGRSTYDDKPDRFDEAWPSDPLPQEGANLAELEPKKGLEGAWGADLWEIVRYNLYVAECKQVLSKGLREGIADEMQRQSWDYLLYPRSLYGHVAGYVPRTVEKLLEESSCCTDCRKLRYVHRFGQSGVPSNTLFCDQHTFAAAIVGAEVYKP